MYIDRCPLFLFKQKNLVMKRDDCVPRLMLQSRRLSPVLPSEVRIPVEKKCGTKQVVSMAQEFMMDGCHAQKDQQASRTRLPKHPVVTRRITKPKPFITTQKKQTYRHLQQSLNDEVPRYVMEPKIYARNTREIDRINKEKNKGLKKEATKLVLNTIYHGEI